jgi:S1-C subfamily serine protease
MRWQKLLFISQNICLGIFLNTFFGPIAWADGSIIEKAHHSKQSIVSVYGFRQGIVKADGGILLKSIQQSGAGVILDARGYIVTNLHTIHQSKKVAVSLQDQSLHGARIIKVFPQDDIALLKIDVSVPLTPIVLADSNALTLGETVINIGHSQLLHETISQGKIIGLGTSLDEAGQTLVELIRVNLNLYKGDSGGPLLNQQGNLIGMMAARVKANNDRQASLAISSNKIKKLCAEFLE